MRKLITVIIFVLFLVTAIAPQTGCGGETDKAEPVASESNRWLKLLSVLPENEGTLKAAFLQDNAYLDEKKQQYPQYTEEYAIIRDHPLLFGDSPDDYSDEEWNETLGFTRGDVDQRIYAGELPLSYYEAVRGRISLEDVDSAVKTGPMNEMLEVVPYQGHEFYSWGEDFGINIQYRSGVRPLGRGYRLAYIDGFIFWIKWTDGIKEMIDSYEGNIASLADKEDYVLIAGALEELDTVTAFFSAESQSVSHISEIYKQVIGDPENNELRQRFVEEVQRETRLKPYRAFATGAGLDEDGYYLAIVLANSSKEAARENATLLEQRINQSNIAWAWHSQSGDKWTDLIVNMEIESKGRLTIAKLYGGAAECWVNFNVMGMLGLYEPLLITSDPDEETDTGETPFADSNLEEAVREALSKPSGAITRSDLEQLTSLAAPEESINDITGLELCTNLRTLDLPSNYISDISPLASLTGLTHLDLQSNRVSDISPLSSLTSLTELNLGFNPLDDITPLTSLSGLTSLDLHRNELTDISLLASLDKLTTLNLYGNRISDISPLSSLTNLEVLLIFDNQIADLSPLSSLTNLTELNLMKNLISDVSPLSSLTNLITLNLRINQVSDISPLATLSNIEFMQLSENRISDVSPLASLITIVQLDINENPLSDISPLASLVNLTDLSLRECRISDISSLASLTNLWCLNLFGNQISDIEPLVLNSGLSKGDTVSLNDNPLSDTSINVYIPQLEEREMFVNW